MTGRSLLSASLDTRSNMGHCLFIHWATSHTLAF